MLSFIKGVFSLKGASIAYVLTIVVLAWEDSQIKFNMNGLYSAEELINKVESLRNLDAASTWDRRKDESVMFILKGSYNLPDILRILVDSSYSSYRYGPYKHICFYSFDKDKMVRFRGKILDYKTNKPLPYVEIVTQFGWGALSDRDGNFSIDLSESCEIWFITEDRRQSLNIPVFIEDYGLGETINLTVLIEKGTGLTLDALQYELMPAQQ